MSYPSLVVMFSLSASTANRCCNCILASFSCRLSTWRFRWPSFTVRSCRTNVWACLSSRIFSIPLFISLKIKNIMKHTNNKWMIIHKEKIPKMYSLTYVRYLVFEIWVKIWLTFLHKRQISKKWPFTFWTTTQKLHIADRANQTIQGVHRTLVSASWLPEGWHFYTISSSKEMPTVLSFSRTT